MKHIYMGVDVSKDYLDIYLEGHSHKITNTETGISAFVNKHMRAEGYLIALEPTGGYEREALKVFGKKNFGIHMAHPNKVRHFSKSFGTKAKTDKLDAKLLCRYLEVNKLEPNYKKYSEVQDNIFYLRRLSRSFEYNLHGAQCRIKQMPPATRKHLEEQIAFYKKKIESIHQEIKEAVMSDKELKKKFEIMITRKGVGDKTAIILLAEMPEIGSCNRREIASLAGVAPITHSSGKSVGKSYIFGGRFGVRRALYMSALVCARHDLLLKKKYEKFISKGKPKKKALVALMRDILTCLNSMLKEEKKFVLQKAA